MAFPIANTQSAVRSGGSPNAPTRAELGDLQTKFLTAKATHEQLRSQLAGRDDGWAPRAPRPKGLTGRDVEAAQRSTYLAAVKTVFRVREYLETHAPGARVTVPHVAGRAPTLDDSPIYQALSKGRLLEFIDETVAASRKK